MPFITSSAAPISSLVEMQASAVNANVRAYALSPMATEIEKQILQWLSQLIGYDSGAGGIFMSGGNMANSKKIKSLCFKLFLHIIKLGKHQYSLKLLSDSLAL